jgi:hypothetical protein
MTRDSYQLLMEASQDVRYLVKQPAGGKPSSSPGYYAPADADGFPNVHLARIREKLGNSLGVDMK